MKPMNYEHLQAWAAIERDLFIWLIGAAAGFGIAYLVLT